MPDFFSFGDSDYPIRRAISLEALRLLWKLHFSASRRGKASLPSLSKRLKAMPPDQVRAELTNAAMHYAWALRGLDYAPDDLRPSSKMRIQPQDKLPAFLAFVATPESLFSKPAIDEAVEIAVCLLDIYGYALVAGANKQNISGKFARELTPELENDSEHEHADALQMAFSQHIERLLKLHWAKKKPAMDYETAKAGRMANVEAEKPRYAYNIWNAWELLPEGNPYN